MHPHAKKMPGTNATVPLDTPPSLRLCGASERIKGWVQEEGHWLCRQLQERGSAALWTAPVRLALPAGLDGSRTLALWWVTKPTLRVQRWRAQLLKALEQEPTTAPDSPYARLSGAALRYEQVLFEGPKLYTGETDKVAYLAHVQEKHTSVFVLTQRGRAVGYCVVSMGVGAVQRNARWAQLLVQVHEVWLAPSLRHLGVASAFRDAIALWFSQKCLMLQDLCLEHRRNLRLLVRLQAQICSASGRAFVERLAQRLDEQFCLLAPRLGRIRLQHIDMQDTVIH